MTDRGASTTGGRGLTWLLHDVDTRRFFDQFWEQRPLVVRAANAHRYADVLTLDDLEAVVAATPVDIGHVGASAAVSATSYVDGCPVDLDLETDRTLRPTSTAVHAALGAGATIIVRHLRRTWAPVSQLCREVEEELGHPMSANLYLTPPDAQGYGRHYDAADVFFLQVEGRKRWRVHAPVAELPTAVDLSLVRAKELAEPIMDVVLDPGDLLFLPRGWIHEGVTGRDASLHLTLGTIPTTWLDLAIEHLRNLAAGDVDLRRALPLAATTGSGPSTIANLRSIAATHLVEAIGDGMSRDVESSIQSLRARVMSSQSPPLDGHVRTLLKLSTMNDDSVLVRRRGLAPSIVTGPADVSVHASGSFVSGPLEARDALLFAATNDRFRIGDLPEPLDASGRSELAMALVREGLFSVERAQTNRPSSPRN